MFDNIAGLQERQPAGICDIGLRDANSAAEDIAAHRRRRLPVPVVLQVAKHQLAHQTPGLRMHPYPKPVCPGVGRKAHQVSPAEAPKPSGTHAGVWCRPHCDRTIDRIGGLYLATAGQGRGHHALPEALLALRDYAWEVSNEGGRAKIGVYLHTHRTLAVPPASHVARKLSSSDRQSCRANARKHQNTLKQCSGTLVGQRWDGHLAAQGLVVLTSIKQGCRATHPLVLVRCTASSVVLA